MARSVLIFEPDSPSNAEFLARAAREAAPGLVVRATGDRREALLIATGASALVAKAQDVTPEILAAMPALDWIQALTTGIDPLYTLGLPAGLRVTTMRGIHGPQMAELAILLMLSLSRGVPRMFANQRQSTWQRWGQPVLLAKTVVIVGVGAISEALADRCQAFGLHVIGVSARRAAAGFDEMYPRERLVEIAARADYLVLLAPYSPATHHLIDATVLAAMKPSSFLINIARGGVVDEAALLAALTERRIAGAGLDVFATEPLPAVSPLWALDNVIVTPHIGGMSDIYAEQALPVLLRNVAAYAAGDFAAMQNHVSLQR